MDLNSQTNTDLEKLIERATTILNARRERERTEKIDQLKALAAEAGVSITIRESAGATRKAGGSSTAKYRNPDNPSQTWSGRGRAPGWLTALEASGKHRADFLIVKS